jgi:GntR family transcriptional regulator, transcriptional repressor for pyruvate dehydrogenase complex
MAAEGKPTPEISGAFRPLKPPRNLTSELTARLTEEISSGNLAPHARLPTEQEMIATFGVSRTVVREAIAALRAEGLVESRQGAGVFVAGDMSRRPFRLDPEGLQDIKAVIDLMELRMSVEIEAAGLAAERRTQKNIAEIERAVNQSDKAVKERDETVEPDYQFHLAVSRATQNDYFCSFIEYLGRHIIPRRTVHVSAQSGGDRRAYLAKVLNEHRTILKAIVDGDATRARAAMRKHLQEGRDRYVKLVEGAN